MRLLMVAFALLGLGMSVVGVFVYDNDLALVVMGQSMFVVGFLALLVLRGQR